MAYTKVVTLNEQQDMYLQEELQRLKAEVFEPMDGQIGNIAQSILALLEQAPVIDPT